MKTFSSKYLLVVWLLSFLVVFAEDWPHWRGPDRNGISKEKGWSESWPEAGPPIAWKGQVGTGYSSFAVAGGRVYTIGHADGKDTIFCFDAAKGVRLWAHSYPSDLGDKYFEGGPTSTPAVDGNRLYVLSRWGDVFCLNAESGKVLWHRNIQKETNARIPTWGFAGSPVIYKKLVLLNVGEGGTGLDKTTGETVWTSGTKDAGYTTPVLAEHAGKKSLLLGNSTSYLAVDPENGKEIWRFKWLTQYGVNAADPVIAGDKVFISSGYEKGGALLKPGSGSEPQVLWKNNVLRTQMNPAVLVGEHLYGVDGDTSDKAVLKCVELSTGKEIWMHPGTGSGGLIVVDGKILILTERGKLMLAPASPTGFAPIAQAQVLGGKSWTAPVLANGMVYCRNSRGDVVCVDLRKKS